MNKNLLQLLIKFIIITAFLLLYSVSIYGGDFKLAYIHVFDSSSIKTDFLSRVKNSGYNYIIAALLINENDDRISYRNRVKYTFQRTNEYGLRLIPLIQTGSQWSDHWINVRNSWGYNNMAMTRCDCHNIIKNQYPTQGVPSFSYEPYGYDAAFYEVMLQIRYAHNESGVTYPLEYVHLGQDEPAVTDRLIIGNCKKGTSQGWEIIRVIDSCNADMDFITNYQGTKSEAVQELITQSLYRRIDQVKNAFGNQNAKILIWGDVWDPELNGRRPLKLWNGTVINTTPNNEPGIASLSCLSSTQKSKFRENVIIMPWCYDISTSHDGDNYNAVNTFSYLSNNKFNFIYAHEITYDNIKPYLEGRVSQAWNWINAASLFPKNVLGYASVNWADYSSPPPAAFETIEYMSKITKTKSPIKIYMPAIINH